MRYEDFRRVYESPGKFWDFLTQPADEHIEGHHFDRKQAGESSQDGSISSSKLSGLFAKVEKTISAFGNADGGLLIVGIDTSGVPVGIAHLSEDQRSSLLAMHSLKGGVFHSRIYTHSSASDTVSELALFCVEPDKRDYCRRIKDGAAWIRRGPSSVPLSDDGIERLKRDRKIVDFERVHRELYESNDTDDDVLAEFVKSDDIGTYDQSDEDVLRNAGALAGPDGTREWTNAGLLFFAANPQRLLHQAAIRLLRFDCAYDDEDVRPTPSFDRTLTGPLTKQIRDFRTLVSESGLFKVYQIRRSAGGFDEEPEYPFIALDEAVVNAVAHRDYGDRQLVLCEKYDDAFIVKSPGRLLQDMPLPPTFRLADQRLDHCPRNVLLIGWFRRMKDAHGAPYVKALREGTRRMQDEMELLGLPSPEYKLTDSGTVLILRNNAKQRGAKRTGLAAETIESDEFTNLYRLTGLEISGQFDKSRDTRRLIVGSLCNKLEASGWVIDSVGKGRCIAHRKGSMSPTPAALHRTVRIIPAYSFSVRSYFDRDYLIVDFTIQVRSVLTAQSAIARFGSEAVLNLRASASADSGVVRGRIAGVEGENITLRSFDSQEDEILPSAVVYPELRREAIDELVREAAPNFDLATAIKTEALANQRGAARTRAKRIHDIVEQVSRDIFPIVVSGDKINIDVEPLKLLVDGDGKRAFRVAQIKEPEVEFRAHHSTDNIRDGITSFGAYDDDPRRVEVIAVVHAGYKEAATRLASRLQTGKFKYRGSERTFATRLQFPIITEVAGGDVESECARLLDQYPEWKGNPSLNRIMLVHTPEDGYALDDVNSPYYRIKRRLLEAGIPCQMVNTPTLQNADYKDLNLALNLSAKTGLTPWVLPDSIPDADFFVGLSYTSSRRAEDERLLGFANVFNHYGRWEFYSGGDAAVRYSDREKHYEQLAKRTLARITLPDRPTICFHYSARFSRTDRLAILRGARRICPNGRYVFVWINSHTPVRLFDERAETDGSLGRGRYVVTASNQICLSTTGYNPYKKMLGSPRALEVNAYVDHAPGERPSPIDHRALARQILSLTKLNWASTDSLCAEPITTKYAGDIAYLTQAFQAQGEGPFKLHEVLDRTPWFI